MQKSGLKKHLKTLLKRNENCMFDEQETAQLLKEHLKILTNAAKKECSGEELKAITQAILLLLAYSADSI